MKPLKNTTLYSRLALITSVTLVVGYFVVYAAWTTINPVNTWDTLTKSLVNNILGNLTDLDGRVSNFGFSSGNVGIGTANPGVKLQVNTTTDWNIARFIGLSSSLYLQSEANYFSLYWYDSLSAAKDINISAIWWWTQQLYLKNNGNVWIWTISPAEKLEVNGMIRVTDNGNGSGRIRPKFVASVSTTPVIMGRVGYGGLFVIMGYGGVSSMDQFSDLVFYAYGNLPHVISSKTVAWTPAARIYAASLYDFTLQMASGTYSVSSVGMTN